MTVHYSIITVVSQRYDCASQATNGRARSCWPSTLRDWRTKRKRRQISRGLTMKKKTDMRMGPMKDLEMSWKMAKMLRISIAR